MDYLWKMLHLHSSVGLSHLSRHLFKSSLRQIVGHRGLQRQKSALRAAKEHRRITSAKAAGKLHIQQSQNNKHIGGQHQAEHYVGKEKTKLNVKRMSNHNNYIDKMEVGKSILIKRQDGTNIKNGMVGNIDKQLLHHQDWNDDLAWYRPIGAGHEWDDYIRHRQQQARRCISENMGKTARWRTSKQDLPQQLPSTGYMAHRDLVIIIDQDECHHPATNPRVHHDLLPDILSHTITHVLNLGLPASRDQVTSCSQHFTLYHQE